ncbi:hypothetical protein EJB05_09264, partial [Eragrostis curvula]
MTPTSQRMARQSSASRLCRRRSSSSFAMNMALPQPRPGAAVSGSAAAALIWCPGVVRGVKTPVSAGSSYAAVPARSSRLNLTAPARAPPPSG